MKNSGFVKYLLRHLLRSMGIGIDWNLAGEGEICTICNSEVTQGLDSCQNCGANRVMNLTPEDEKIRSFSDKFGFLWKLSGLITLIIILAVIVAGFVFIDSIDSAFRFIKTIAPSMPPFLISFAVLTVLYIFVNIITSEQIIRKNAYTVEYRKN